MAAPVLVDCKIFSLAASLAVVLLLSRSSYGRTSTESSFHESSHIVEADQVEVVTARHRRQTTSYIGTDSPTSNSADYTGVGEDEEGGDDEGPGDDEDDAGDDEEEESCTQPRQPQPEYNNSCEYIHTECRGKTKLVNYLSLVVCDLRVVQPLGYVLLILWLVYLISLLATTVDNYFVPPLNFLAEKLKLSPSIAGITLLALGNGAPDIFVVYSGLAQDDLALVLGSLTGAGIFITTVVIGTVVVVSKTRPFNIDKIDFIRDVVALMIVVATVVAVAFDGVVYLLEACIFPLLYFAYVTAVIFISYARVWWKKKSQANSTTGDEEVLYNEFEDNASTSLPMRYITETDQVDKATLMDKNNEAEPLANKETINRRTVLHGLTWPSGSHIVVKCLWLVQWPFSLLRWMTVPPFGYNRRWSKWHYLFAASSPTPMAMLMLLAVKGWEGFTIDVGKMPLPAMLAVIGVAFSVLLFLVLSSKNPPHWSIQCVLVPIAFVMSIVWLNIQANEVVSILRSFGLLLDIDTAILGLTVLALGNCMADWVADTLVARAGKPEMAFASCFGSPLLSHVLGLSIALIVKIAVYNHGAPYTFHIHTPEYSQVKLSWIFLGISLVGCLIMFPAFRFSPPRPYGVVLMLIYLVFIVVAVLCESGVFPVNF